MIWKGFFLLLLFFIWLGGVAECSVTIQFNQAVTSGVETLSINSEAPAAAAPPLTTRVCLQQCVSLMLKYPTLQQK